MTAGRSQEVSSPSLSWIPNCSRPGAMAMAPRAQAFCTRPCSLPTTIVASCMPLARSIATAQRPLGRNLALSKSSQAAGTESSHGGEGERTEGDKNFLVGASVVGMVLLVATGGSAGASVGVPGLGPVVRFPWEQVRVQEEPQRGNCATCIGVVDDTLGSCNATPNCVSSFDDRPNFFVAPWEFPGKLEPAVVKLKGALLRSGATIKDQGERYIYAVFTGEDGVSDDMEFLFSEPSVDATVNVPILRNRQRRLFFAESPWDTFGPEPPPTFDYKEGLEFVPE